MNPNPALQLTGVVKRFGATTAVAGVDLAVADGELLALVGPSGCGKSTLLRIVAGLVPADEGEVRLGGTVVDDGRHPLPPEERHVGLVFQEHALFPHLSVGDNLAFGLRSMSRAERRATGARWLEVVGLPGYADRYPHELSGGERQRVALARALAPRPRLVLLDEPFASLDPNLRQQVRAEVVALLRESGTPAVFVTHDQTEAMAVGDRVAVMRQGRIEHAGTPFEVFHTPASRFVAAFMGDAAFVPIDGWHHDEGVTELGPVHVPAGPGAAVVAMARPDDVTFVPTPHGTAEIVGVEFRGPTWHYTLRLASGAEVHSTRSHLVRAQPGDRVAVELVAGHRLVPVPT